MSRIKDKVEEINKFLEEFKKIIPDTFKKYESNIEKKAACERYFEKIVEAAVDLTFLIIKEIGLRDAKEDTDAFVVLAEAGFIDKELSEKLQDAKSMRNLIVHQYEIIEDIRVYEAVKDKLPADINNFLSKIKKHKQD